MIRLKWIVHGYNLLFLLSNTLFSTWINIVFTGAYGLWIARSLIQRPPFGGGDLRALFRACIPGWFTVGVFFFLATVGFGYLIHGPMTVPNWDYYKYNTLLDGISHSLGHPSVVWGRDGQIHALAYYYVIFLPSVWLSKLLALDGALRVFQLQALFVGINVVVATMLLSSVLAEVKHKRSFLFLLLFLVGLDGLFFPFLTWGMAPHWVNDIQNGGANWYFSPLRIQDFTNYFFWLPGHTIAALAAMKVLLVIDKGRATDPKVMSFIAGPFLLYLASTSVFSFMAFGVCLAVGYLERYGLDGLLLWKGVMLHRKALAIAVGVVVGMGCFYGYQREYAGFGIFISLHMLHLSPVKWVLFILQEFGLFLGFYWLYRPRPAFLALMGVMTVLSLGASRDLLMSSSILFLLMMVYFAAQTWDLKQHIRAAVIIMLLGLPSLLFTGVGIFDLAREYPDRMSSGEAKGAKCQTVIDDVIRGYIRK